MKTIKAQIENAKTSAELMNIIESLYLIKIEKYQQLAKILDKAFWYGDLNTFGKRQNWMLFKIEKI